MIEIVHTDIGEIKAVCEYYVVNEDGSMNDKGLYAWIVEAEVSPQYRNNGCLGKFVELITKRYPQLQFGYFKRLKYKGRIKMYSKRRWLSLIKEDTNGKG